MKLYTIFVKLEDDDEKVTSPNFVQIHENLFLEVNYKVNCL